MSKRRNKRKLKAWLKRMGIQESTAPPPPPKPKTVYAWRVLKYDPEIILVSHKGTQIIFSPRGSYVHDSRDDSIISRRILLKELKRMLGEQGKTVYDRAILCWELI